MLDTPVLSRPEESDIELTLSDRIVKRLSRVTSGGRFLPEIDGLRFFAIAGVLFAHIFALVTLSSIYANRDLNGSLMGYILDHGADGVRLFFSISGFILALPFAESYLNGKNRPKLAKYYTRRVTRLEPPYITALIVGLVGVSIYGSSFHKEIPHFFASMLYLHAIIYHIPSTISGILWSLEIEAQFYLLAPFLAMVFRISDTRIRRVVLVLGIAFGMALQRKLIPYYGNFFHFTILGNLYYFLVGFLAVDIYLGNWRHSTSKNYLWDIVVLAGIAVNLLLGYYVSYTIYWFTFPIAVLLAYNASFRGVITSKIVCNRWLVVTGGMCYTIYLYHMIIIRTSWVVLTHHLLLTRICTLDYLIQLLLLGPIILVLSSLLFITFEKPFMQKDWPKRWRETISSYLRGTAIKGSAKD